MRALTPYLSVVFIFSLLTAACSSDKKKKSGVKYIYVGDPMKLIEGTKLNPQVDMQFFADDEDKKVSLVSTVTYSEKHILESHIKDLEDLEEEEAPDAAESVLHQNVVNLNVSFEPESKAVRFLMGTDAAFSLVEKSSSPETSESKSYLLVFADQKAKVLHFSRSDDGAMVSLLIQHYSVTKGASLTVLYFAKDWAPSPAPKSDKDYFYLLGMGVKYAWLEPRLDIRMCGPNAGPYYELVRRSVRKWQDVLKDRLEIDIQIEKDSPPFSDLNKNCIYFVETYLASGDPTISQYGITLNIPDFKKHSFLSSNMVIFLDEFKRLRLELEKTTSMHPAHIEKGVLHILESTIIHEFGHTLGLDHQFTGVSSVMSYDYDGLELQDYDRAAVQELYPLRETAVSPVALSVRETSVPRVRGAAGRKH